jgi:VCBS repeat-containing protein
MKNQRFDSGMSVWGVFRAIMEACKKAGWTGVTAMLVACAAIAGMMNVPVPGAFGAQAGGGSSPTYTFTPIDVPGVGKFALQGSLGITNNAGGDVAGVYISNSYAAHGFVRAAATGTISTFDAPNAGISQNQGTFVAKIEPGGNITGMYADSSNAYHGFLRAPNGTITEFDVAGAPTNIGHRGTIPLGINVALQITGFYVDTNAVRHGFIRAADGTFTTFDFPGAGTGPTQGTMPVKINGPGGVMGFYVDGNQVFHGFVRNAKGTFIGPIDAPNASRGPGGVGKGITLTGTIVHSFDGLGGVAGIYTDASGMFHGFLLSVNSVFTSIDVPGASQAGVFRGTLLTAEDGLGDVTGAYSDANGVEHGFTIVGGTSTINAPLDAPGVNTSGFFAGTVPFSINGTGELAGTFTDTSGLFHAFMATASAVATPAFSPAPGTYSSSQSVTMSDATPNSVIFFTTDGTSPATSATAQQYSGPITVSSTETIQAIAGAAGFANSAIVSGTYTINNSPDFQVSVNPTTLTIVAGQSGTATFTVTPQNGFNSQVSFACSGLPAEAACSFNPTSVTPSGSAVSSTLTVTTTAAMAAMRTPMPTSQRPTYAVLFSVLAVIFGFAARRRQALRGLSLLGLLVFLIVVSGLSSCGGGSTGTGNSGTPFGTTVASVSAAAGGGSKHAANLTITITH